MNNGKNNSIFLCLLMPIYKKLKSKTNWIFLSYEKNRNNEGWILVDRDNKTMPATIPRCVFNMKYKRQDFGKTKKFDQQASFISFMHTGESLKGQSLGFPLPPHLSKYAPFFIDTIAWTAKQTNFSDSLWGNVNKHLVTLAIS